MLLYISFLLQVSQIAATYIGPRTGPVIERNYNRIQLERKQKVLTHKVFLFAGQDESSSPLVFASKAKQSRSVILNGVKNLVFSRLRSFVPQDDKTFEPSLRPGSSLRGLNRTEGACSFRKSYIRLTQRLEASPSPTLKIPDAKRKGVG